MNTAASSVIDGSGDFPDPLDDFAYQTALMVTLPQASGNFWCEQRNIFGALCGWMIHTDSHSSQNEVRGRSFSGRGTLVCTERAEGVRGGARLPPLEMVMLTKAKAKAKKKEEKKK